MYKSQTTDIEEWKKKNGWKRWKKANHLSSRTIGYFQPVERMRGREVGEREDEEQGKNVRHRDGQKRSRRGEKNGNH